MTSRARHAAAVAVATGVATLALAAPAAGMVDQAPPPTFADTLRHTQHVPSGTGLTSLPARPVPVAEQGTPWGEIAVAALGGVALAGAAIGAGAAVRRRSAAVHPA